MSATATVVVRTADDRTPLPDYYDLYYTTAAADAEGQVSADAWQEAHTHTIANDRNTYTITIAVTDQGQPTALPLRIQARAINGEQFYEASAVYLHFLIHPGYTGGSLEAVNTAADAPAAGTIGNPYNIYNPFSLFSAANLINNDATGT